ncbi:TonB-dependent receptor [Algibacter aquimarinus]|uniref:TonB-dependent receptor n=2 Tax=Algibacter aquimarinus TaxID=1136748 RepID=A0ABP9H0E7_9FLAO
MFAQVLNTSGEIITTTKINGTFEILKPGIYSFKKEGYLKKTLDLTKESYNTIQLDINPSELNEIIINTNHIPQKLKKATAAISIISNEDIQRFNNVDFAPILNRTPGVFMQSGALNTNRITIRGIGSRNLFGTSKIRAYFKDIPLTNGSGETTIEDFELASISRFEIIKGATSSIYGAGLGGAIHINPQNAFLKQTNLNSELLVGDFGLIKGIVNLNYGTSKNSIRAVYSNTHSNGYRDNNKYDRQTFTINTNHFLNKKNELSFLISYVDLKAFIPSSLNEETFLNNPKAAAFTWKQSQGFEDSKRGVFGLSWNHNYNQKLKQITSIFTSFRNAYEPRPFNILSENTFALGIRSRVLGNTLIFNKTLNWTIGGELFKDTYKYKTFDNLYEDFPAGTGSVEGDNLSNFKEIRDYYNLFFETNYEISKKSTFTIGLNLNQTSYNLDDRFEVSNENPDQSGSYKFGDILSPKFGFSHEFSKNLSGFSSISHGFSPISLNETLLPNGQLNTNLKPETGWNFEIGTRGSALKNRLQFNLSLFRLDIKNLLVSRRTSEDEFIGINAGKTQHEGLELAINYQWLNKEKIAINTFLNFTQNNFIFKEFIDEENDFSGNDLTGVPSNVLNAGVDFNSASGVYGNINFQQVGSMPITDSNSLYTSSYQLSNLKIGYRIDINKKVQVNLFFGLNNIFDEDYASQILINASSFGGNAPRYFYPGNPRNYYAGINMNYIF